jgi:hypothetical protein
VHGLPRGAVQAQGATWIDAEGNALALVAGLLQADPGTVGIRVEPADEKEAAALAAVVETRGARVLAEEAERDAVRQAGRTASDRPGLVDAGRGRGAVTVASTDLPTRPPAHKAGDRRPAEAAHTSGPLHGPNGGG